MQGQSFRNGLSVKFYLSQLNAFILSSINLPHSYKTALKLMVSFLSARFGSRAQSAAMDYDHSPREANNRLRQIHPRRFHPLKGRH